MEQTIVAFNCGVWGVLELARNTMTVFEAFGCIRLGRASMKIKLYILKDEIRHCQLVNFVTPLMP